MKYRHIHYRYLGLILGLALFSLAAASRHEPAAGNAPLSNHPEGEAPQGSVMQSLFAQVPPPPIDTTNPNARFDLPAEQVFKNIQLFKGVSAREVLGTMDFMKVALGVNCGFCHVSNDFAADDKPEKKTARTMILMQRDINNKNFGATLVTCYTCHQGHPGPLAVPPLAGDLWRRHDTRYWPSAGLQETSVDQVLARYIQALGGEGALKKMTTRVAKGTAQGSDSAVAPVEEYRKAPDMFYGISRSGDPKRGDMIEGSDGKVVWSQIGGRRTRVLMNDERAQIQRQAEFFPAQNLRSQFTGLQLLGRDTVGGREFYVLSATAPDSSHDRLFFDTHTGLLAHRYVEHEGLLGGLPFSIDYDDYHTVDGVAVPYRTHWTTPQEIWTEMLTDVRFNVAVDDTKFAMPPMTAPSKPPSK